MGKLANEIVSFLSGDAYLAKIRESLQASKNTSLAVAFWGDGAIKELGLSRPKGAKILCNLSMGGTNPRVIEQLLEGGFEVKHSPWLHAKIFLFDDLAIVGSANASCNGLGFEGSESRPWDEAGILMRGNASLRPVRKWFDDQFDAAKHIDSEVMRIAWEAWKRRRKSRPALPDTNAALTVFDALQRFPDSFRDREIYLTCDTTRLDESGKVAEKEIKTQYGPEFEIWQDWPEMPRDAALISFYASRNGYRLDGIFRSDSAIPDQKKGKTLVQIAQRMSELSVAGVSPKLSKNTLGNEDEWRSLIELVRSHSQKAWDADAGCCIRLDRLAKLMGLGFPLIEISESAASEAEWNPKPVFSLGSVPSSMKAKWEKEGVWLWEKDASVADLNPLWVLHCETKDRETIDWSECSWHRIEKVIEDGVTCRGHRLSLGVSSGDRAPPYEIDRRFRTAFLGALKKRPELRALLGLTGEAKSEWSRTGWFDAQTTQEARVLMRGFWDEVASRTRP